MTANKKKYGVVLITGASAGIGRELALEFGTLPEGWTDLSSCAGNYLGVIGD